MNIDSFDELVAHVGHNVIVVGYGREGENQYAHVALECETCDAFCSSGTARPSRVDRILRAHLAAIDVMRTATSRTPEANPDRLLRPSLRREHAALLPSPSALLHVQESAAARFSARYFSTAEIARPGPA